MNNSNFIASIAAFFGAAVSWFFGGANGFIYALIAFCIMDYITGILAAWEKCILSSSTGFKGIAKKITIFILVGITNIIDRELLGHNAFLRDAVISFYLANEGLSILENAVLIGIPIPEVLKSKLLQLKDNKDNKENSKQKKSG